MSPGISAMSMFMKKLNPIFDRNRLMRIIPKKNELSQGLALICSS